VRPAVLLLCARACGYEGTEHVKLAAATEIVHTATLLHDDVVDASELRRGQSTANTIWGNEASVLVGDFLYSRSTQLLVETQRLDILDVVSDAANNIAEGELLQLVSVRKSNISEEAYFEIIRSKTARLFEASAQIGAMIAHASPSWEQALAKYGIHLGNAFQLIDDVLDYQGDVEAIGKNVGDDLADGKTTLPLIYAMRLAMQNKQMSFDKPSKKATSHNWLQWQRPLNQPARSNTLPILPKGSLNRPLLKLPACQIPNTAKPSNNLRYSWWNEPFDSNL